MFVPLVASLLAVYRGDVTKCGDNEIVFRGRCYEQEVLVDKLDWIQNLVVDFHTNVLYFSNGSIFAQSYSSCYYDLNTKELGVITQVPGGTAQAVDQVRHEVYIGGNDGLYKFYYNNKTVERLLASDGEKQSMFYKNQLYFCRNSRTFNVTNGKISEVKDISQYMTPFFMIDKDEYWFFDNVFCPSGKEKGSEVVDCYDKDMEIYSMTTDANGIAYLCSYDKIYFVNKHRKELQVIGTLPHWCGQLAFDRDDNIIYGAYDRIIKLKLKAEN